MSYRVEAIRAALESLHPQLLEIEDESALHVGHAGVRGHGGGHYAVHIVAACFAGKSRLARHRMVHAALGDAFKDMVHAMSIRAESPDETAG